MEVVVRHGGGFGSWTGGRRTGGDGIAACHSKQKNSRGGNQEMEANDVRAPNGSYRTMHSDPPPLPQRMRVGIFHFAVSDAVAVGRRGSQGLPSP